jgi:hypothetical protein
MGLPHLLFLLHLYTTIVEKSPTPRLASLVAVSRAVVHPPQAASPPREALIRVSSHHAPSAPCAPCPSPAAVHRARPLPRRGAADAAVPLANGGASRDAILLVSFPRRCLHRRAPCAAADRNDEPPFLQAARSHCIESACCKYMFQVFQMFYLDVVKVDRDVAHVAMSIHVCCKCMF